MTGLAPIDIILTGVRMGKFSPEDAWQIITEKDLWPDAGGILNPLLEGREVARTRAELSKAHPDAKKAFAGLAQMCEAQGLIDYDSRRFIERLFEGQTQ
jgi:hypothetical protein